MQRNAFRHIFDVSMRRLQPTILLLCCHASRCVPMALSPRLVASRSDSNVYSFDLPCCLELSLFDLSLLRLLK